MCKRICVTNRHLVAVREGETESEALLRQINKLARQGIDSLILREKDLSEEAYERLAKQVLAFCRENQIHCVLHRYPSVAETLGCDSLHIPLAMLQEEPNLIKHFACLGVSVHAKEEALLAESLGASYLVAGHIYETDCKQGLPGRGLGFLADICNSVTIPVYAIGGVTKENWPEVKQAGADGFCSMSFYMKEN